VLALPSDATESFGIVLIEAMASGCPVIATDLPGVRTIVAHGRDGLLIAPGNVEALCQAIATVALMPIAARRAMGQAGRAKVEACYDWERIGERLETMYAEVVAERDARER
jgi:glycosyltransferase involved in cell wall biosynthesis